MLTELLRGAAVLAIASTTLVGQTQWSPWASNGTIGFANNGVAFQWLGNPSGSVIFSPAAWSGSGGWNLRVFAEIASGQSAGNPPTCQPRAFDNGTRLRVEFRVPAGELLSPGVVRPTGVQIRLSNDSGTAPTLWRNIRLVQVSGGNTLFEYRPCSSTPQPGPNGEWGSDGSRTACPTHGPTGTSVFNFAASPTVMKQVLGGPSGFVLGPADVSVVSSTFGDEVSVTLRGATGGNRAWIMISGQNIPGGFPFNFLGTILTIYIAMPEIIGPVPVDSRGEAIIGPFSVVPTIGPAPFYVQWIAEQPTANPIGLSDGLQVQVVYRCN